MDNQPCPNCGGTDIDFCYDGNSNHSGILKCKFKCGLSMCAETEQKAWEKWNAFNLKLGQIVTQNCIAFAAEYAYRKKNPTSKMDVPSIVYEDALKKYKQWIEKHQKRK